MTNRLRARFSKAKLTPSSTNWASTNYRLSSSFSFTNECPVKVRWVRLNNVTRVVIGWSRSCGISVVGNHVIGLQTISADNKTARLANLTAAEKEFLVELALKYQAVIEKKKSDKVTGHLSFVQNSNNNDLSSSVIVEFYLTGCWQSVKFLSTWRSVNCWRNSINQMLVKSAGNSTLTAG